MTTPHIPHRPHTWVPSTPSESAVRRALTCACGWLPVIKRQCYRWIGRDDDGQWWCFYLYKFGRAHWHGEAQRLVWS